MAFRWCPRCQRKIFYDNNCVDFVHECNSLNQTLDNEDVVKTGDWEDYTGSGTVPRNTVMLQGLPNKLWGSRGEKETDVEDLTRRGEKKTTHRTRKHEEYIKLKENE